MGPFDDGGSDAATGQGTPRAAGSHRKLGHRHATDLPSGPLEETSSAHTLTVNFWPPERQRIYLCCFQSPSLLVCHPSSPGRLIQGLLWTGPTHQVEEFGLPTTGHGQALSSRVQVGAGFGGGWVF